MRFMTESLLCVWLPKWVFHQHLGLLFQQFCRVWIDKLILKHLTPKFSPQKSDFHLLIWLYVFTFHLIPVSCAINHHFDFHPTSLVCFSFSREIQPNYGATSSVGARKPRRTLSVIYCVHGKVAADCCDAELLDVQTIRTAECE